MSYTHAGGIDRPLAIWKSGVGTIVTHQNWRGQFARGTFGVGPRAGQSSDCPSYPPSNGCIPVPWPGWNTTAWHDGVGSQSTTGYEHYWFGSLANEMRDASGQMYAQPLLRSADRPVCMEILGTAKESSLLPIQNS